MKKVIFVSDIHLSHNPPSLRHEEPDWYEAMRRVLCELRMLQRRLDAIVLCAGDVFDAWNSPPELINFAIEQLPKMYAIPGQHDLPYHNYEKIEQSAYWTLVEAGTITNIEPGTYIETYGYKIHGFPYGFPLVPNEKKDDDIHIALVHSYCWIDGKSHGNASEKTNLRNYEISGYDFVAFGDNHIGFVSGNVINCGGLFRRTKADMNRNPFVGVLINGKIKKHLIDCSQDVYSLQDRQVKVNFNEFLHDVKELGDIAGKDIKDIIVDYCKKLDNRIAKILIETLEECS